jgi:hypothetical protein
MAATVPSRLVAIITAADPATRDQSMESVCRGAALEELLGESAALERFRRESGNLYERVRALFFLYAIHRFHMPARLAGEVPIAHAIGLPEGESRGVGHLDAALIPYEGYQHLLNRRFEEAIETFLSTQESNGPSDAVSSALATAYRDLGLQTLANQVRRSVRSLRGNQWMFRVGHPADHALRIRPELLAKSAVGPDGAGMYPVLRESTPVRMDLSHSGWSDIFFLGMDFPEGARVLNVSIDLAVHGRDAAPKPPVEAYLRVIDEPVLAADQRGPRRHGRDHRSCGSV